MFFLPVSTAMLSSCCCFTFNTGARHLFFIYHWSLARLKRSKISSEPLMSLVTCSKHLQNPPSPTPTTPTSNAFMLYVSLKLYSCGKECVVSAEMILPPSLLSFHIYVCNTINLLRKNMQNQNVKFELIYLRLSNINI